MQPQAKRNTQKLEEASTDLPLDLQREFVAPVDNFILDA